MPMNFVAMTANSKPIDRHNRASVFDMILRSHTRLKYCCVGKLPLVKISNHHWQLRLRGRLSYPGCSQPPWPAPRGGHTLENLEGSFARCVAAARYFWLSSGLDWKSASDLKLDFPNKMGTSRLRNRWRNEAASQRP